MQSINNLSKEEQKVIIAQDVLDQIAARRYIANTGCYIRRMNGSYTSYEDDIKENWDKIYSCEVCAIGACLMSITHYKNKLKFNQTPSCKYDWDKIYTELLTSVFTPEEVTIMEIMFEGVYEEGIDNIGRDILYYNTDSETTKKAIAWCEERRDEDNKDNEDRKEEKEKEDEQVLTAIMENIISNKGNIVI